MPEIVWQPVGPTNHTIPEEWNELPEGTIVRCDCGKLGIYDRDDYGVPVWRHMRRGEILFYRIFDPARIGRVNQHTRIENRKN